MRDNLKAVGAQGERAARAHLERLGWRIVTANFRCAAGEMDLIAEEPAGEGTVIVFVEVKTRRGSRHGAAIEAVDGRKSARLRQIAQAFLAARDAGGDEPACRFDIAVVHLQPDGRHSVTLHRGV